MTALRRSNERRRYTSTYFKNLFENVNVEREFQCIHPFLVTDCRVGIHNLKAGPPQILAIWYRCIGLRVIMIGLQILDYRALHAPQIEPWFQAFEE